MVATLSVIRRKHGIRAAALGLMVAAVVCLVRPTAAASQDLVLSDHRLYLAGDTLRVDVALESLFSVRALDAIASGMTTSIVVEFRLEGPRGFRARGRAVRVLLVHDIWEGRYQAIRYGSRSDTLETSSFDEARTFCSGIPAADLGRLPDGNDRYVLKARVSVNPITEAQRRRTRSWLNFLRRGSILELFFSLDTPIERTAWLDVQQFRREDLQ